MSGENDLYFAQSEPVLFQEDFGNEGDILSSEFDSNFFSNPSGLSEQPGLHDESFGALGTMELMGSVEDDDDVFKQLDDDKPSKSILRGVNAGRDIHDMSVYPDNYQGRIDRGVVIQGDTNLVGSGSLLVSTSGGNRSVATIGKQSSSNGGPDDSKASYPTAPPHGSSYFANGKLEPGRFDANPTPVSSTAIALASIPTPPIPQSALMTTVIPPAPVPSAGIHHQPPPMVMPNHHFSSNSLPHFSGVPAPPMMNSGMPYPSLPESFMTRSISMPSMAMPPLSPTGRRPGGMGPGGSPPKPAKEQGSPQGSSSNGQGHHQDGGPGRAKGAKGQQQQQQQAKAGAMNGSSGGGGVSRKLMPIAPNFHQHLQQMPALPMPRAPNGQPLPPSMPQSAPNGMHHYITPSLPHIPPAPMAAVHLSPPPPPPPGRMARPRADGSSNMPGLPPSQQQDASNGHGHGGGGGAGAGAPAARAMPSGGVGMDGKMGHSRSMPIFMPSAGLVHRAGAAAEAAGGGDRTGGFLQGVGVGMDGSRDCLGPLPQIPPPPRPSLMHRSFSSHALGQLRHVAPPAPPGGQAPGGLQEGKLSGYGGMRAAPLELGGGGSGAGSGRGLLVDGGQRMQPQMSDLQNMNARPLAPTVGGMRRVQSTGDIQSLNGLHHMAMGMGASPMYEEGGFKIGRYTMEERRLRISRYRQKRAERNFNKKIKYACRKTLADSRPRVRGRFAKNDDAEKDDEDGDAIMELEDEDEDNLLMDESSSGDFSEMLNGILSNTTDFPPLAPVKLEEGTTSCC